MTAPPFSHPVSSRIPLKPHQLAPFPSWSVTKCPDCWWSWGYSTLPFLSWTIWALSLLMNVIWSGSRGFDCRRLCWYVPRYDWYSLGDYVPRETDASASFITLLISRWITHRKTTQGEWNREGYLKENEGEQWKDISLLTSNCLWVYSA